MPSGSQSQAPTRRNYRGGPLTRHHQRNAEDANDLEERLHHRTVFEEGASLLACSWQVGSPFHLDRSFFSWISADDICLAMTCVSFRRLNWMGMNHTYLESSEYMAKVPPSPSSSARRTMMTYLTLTPATFRVSMAFPGVRSASDYSPIKDTVHMMRESAPSRSS